MMYEVLGRLVRSFDLKKHTYMDKCTMTVFKDRTGTFGDFT